MKSPKIGFNEEENSFVVYLLGFVLDPEDVKASQKGWVLHWLSN